MVGWHDNSGCTPADLPDNFPFRWAQRTGPSWTAHEIGETVHSDGRGAVDMRGFPDLTVTNDGTPFMVWTDLGPGSCPSGQNCLYAWGADLSAFPNGAATNGEFLGGHQGIGGPRFNQGTGSPPDRLTTIHFGNDSGPPKLNGIGIEPGPVYARAFANGPAGQQHIVWYDGDTIGGRNVWYSDGTPGERVSIKDGTTTNNGFGIAADENNRVHAALADTQLLYMTSADGVSWDPPTVIDSAGGTQSPSVGVDGNGNPHIVYFRGANDLRHAWLEGGQWSNYSVISSPLNTFASISPRATRLVFDRDGRANVLIYHGDVRQITIATGTPGAPPTRLTVSVTGTGGGTVNDVSGGISCVDECSRNFPTDSFVTMTATPGPGSQFAGWVGACSGDGACVARMTSATSVGAVFDLTPPVTNPITVDSLAQKPGAAGDCTLGEAIQAANTDAAVDACPAGSGSDTIILPAGTYTLTVVDNSPNGLPLVTSDITIEGAGAASTIIERSAAAADFRIFGVNGALTLNKLTVRGGRGTAGSGAAGGDLQINNSIFEDNDALTQNGGAIFSNGLVDITIRNSIFRNNSAGGSGAITTVGSLRIENSTFTGNAATGSSTGAISFGFSGSAVIVNTVFDGNSSVNGGGAIGHYDSRTSMTLSGVTVTNNSTGAAGGGIGNSGSMTIVDSTISGNSAPGGNGNGGGIYQGATALTIFGSTISGNNAVRGGGIYRQGGTFNITNSTVSGNTSVQEAGGIANPTALNNVTITGNTSNNNRGSGIFTSGFTMKNTILAGNNGNDCESSSGTSEGHNILGKNSACAFTATTGDQVGTAAAPIDPLLGPLQNNGGPTLTHELLSGSPALDAGNPAAPGSGGDACASGDQRGAIRPGGIACDVGAFELKLGSDLSITKTADPEPAAVGAKLTYTVTVTNHGPDPAGDVVITDVLPGDAELVSSSSGCLGATTVSCFVGGLAIGSSAEVTIEVVPTTPGMITNTASVSAVDDRDVGNNMVSVDTTVPLPTAIPSLTTWALVAMVGLLAVFLLWRTGRLYSTMRRVPGRRSI